MLASTHSWQATVLLLSSRHGKPTAVQHSTAQPASQPVSSNASPILLQPLKHKHCQQHAVRLSMDTACASCGTILPCIRRAPATSHPLPSTSSSPCCCCAAMAIALCTQHTHTHRDTSTRCTRNHHSVCAYHTSAASRPSPPKLGRGWARGSAERLCQTAGGAKEAKGAVEVTPR